MTAPQTKVQAMYEPGAVLKPLQSLSMQEWKAKYLPGPRLSVKDTSVGAQVATDPRTVWTELECDGHRTIVNGWCYVNREAYFICKVPFADMLDNIEVPL